MAATSRLTNQTGISLPLAVWLAADGYDFDPTKTDRAISVTSFIKPIRQILLTERLPPEERPMEDVVDQVSRKFGHAIHDSIEHAWKHSRKESLLRLGFPESVIDRIVVNPTKADFEVFKAAGKEIIPLYLEQRKTRTYRGYTFSGKFDMIFEGRINDHKSTSVYATRGNKDEDYALQGSMYRWISEDMDLDDHMNINWVFTDWQPSMARQDPTYPQYRVQTHTVPLMTVRETQNWIDARLDALEASAWLEEPQLPLCSPKDLWVGESQFKYYSDPAKAQTGGRSTKNFSTMAEAQAHRVSKGRGTVVEVPGKPKACPYCPAFTICTQKDAYDFE